jgi:hypothetical protein
MVKWPKWHKGWPKEDFNYDDNNYSIAKKIKDTIPTKYTIIILTKRPLLNYFKSGLFIELIVTIPKIYIQITLKDPHLRCSHSYLYSL